MTIEMQMRSLQFLEASHLVLLMLPRMVDAFCKNTIGGASETGLTLSVMQIVVLAVCLMGFVQEGATSMLSYIKLYSPSLFNFHCKKRD